MVCRQIGADGIFRYLCFCNRRCSGWECWQADKTPALSNTEQAMDVVTHSVLTCPNCGAPSEEEMPLNACLFFFECPACRTLLRPKPGDCCVFCSFGSVQCPPMQQQGGCCTS